MTKLTDIQAILLATASQRDDGSLYPLPATITAPKPAIAKSIASLIKRGFAEERETEVADTVHRSDGDLRYGIFMTAAGKAAVGIEDGDASDVVLPPADASAEPRQTKVAAVLALLRREGGATNAELIAATGWLPHTTRAALTGLRKKGHAIERGKRGDETCYCIVAG